MRGYLGDEVVDGAGAFVAEFEVLGRGPVFGGRRFLGGGHGAGEIAWC